MSEQIVNLFEPNVYQGCVARIGSLTPQTAGLWGKMNVGQMLAHCSEVQEVLNGKELKNTPLIARIFKKVIRKVAVGPKLYTKNTVTHPQYRIADQRQFDKEKSRLLSVLNDFFNDKKPRKHILFGDMTVEERGWAAFKHLDHHLRQFGV